MTSLAENLNKHQEDIRNIVLEVFNFLEGIPSQNFCPQDKILVDSKYMVILRKQIDNLVVSIIDNCCRKNTLGYIMNDIMSKFQYSNMAGFNLIHSNGEIKPIYSGTQNDVKLAWHQDMMSVLTNVLGTVDRSLISKVFIVACEEYELDALPNKFSSKEAKRLKELEEDSENEEYCSLYLKQLQKNVNENEFETYELDASNTLIKHSKQAFNMNIYHNYHIHDNYVIINIHNASNMTGTRAITQIINLIEFAIKQFSDKYIILCGDSNVYYNKEKMDDITQLSSTFNDIGYNLLINRYVVTKDRPLNFFQNSQTADKGMETNIEDTMILAFPKKLFDTVKFDSEKYFIVDPNNIDFNMQQMFNDTIWAFNGAGIGYKRSTEYRVNITKENFHLYLFSDHIPIYCDIDNIRIIVANNVSVKGARGVNYNKEKYNPSVNLNYLKRVSDKILTPYFIKCLSNLIPKLIVDNAELKSKFRKLQFSATSRKFQTSARKRNEIQFSESDNVKKLKELATFELI